MGLLPLVKGMPLRCTQTIDREHKLFKHSRCTLIGWELDPTDAQLLRVSPEREYALTQVPTALLVEVRQDAFADDDRSPKVIVPIKPQTRCWFGALTCMFQWNSF